MAAYSLVGENVPESFPAFSTATRVLPVYVFGDSHSLAYRDTVIVEETTGQTIATRVRFFSTTACTSETLYGETQGFHPELIGALENEGLIRGGRPTHQSLQPFDLKIGYSTGLPQVSPLIVINAGDVELRSDFLSLLKEERDFVLPDNDDYPTADVPLLPYDICLNRLESRMSALVRGVAALRSHGFTRTSLHCIVPPTTDDARFARVNGFRCPTTTRYKAAVLCNRLLAEQCKKQGIPFIDIWPDVTRNGYLRPEFELDGVHLAPAAVRHSLHQLIRQIILSEAGVNYRRYELLYQLACGREPANDVVPALPCAGMVAPTASVPRRIAARCKRILKGCLSPKVRQQLHALPLVGRLVSTGATVAPNVEVPAVASVAPPIPITGPAWVVDAAGTFQRDGICTLPIEPRLLQKWRGQLEFSHDVGNRNATFEWCGNPIKPFSPNLRYAVPPRDLLDDIRLLFDRPAFDAFFRSILGCQIMVMNCRPLLSLPHQHSGQGPQAFHLDGNPAGILRAIVYLTDVTVDSGPFEYKDADGNAHPMTAPAGTMLIFDANRLVHRGSPPRNAPRQVIDMVLCPRLPGQEMLVVSAGMNNWPFDPFQFTLRGMQTSPPSKFNSVSLPPYDVGKLLAMRGKSAESVAAAA